MDIMPKNKIKMMKEINSKTRKEKLNVAFGVY